MFYINEKRGDLYGVTDTNDGICEFYSSKDIFSISEKTSIMGVLCNRSVDVVGIDTVLAMEKLLRGTTDGIKCKFSVNYLDDYELISIHKRFSFSSNAVRFCLYSYRDDNFIQCSDICSVPRILENSKIRIKNLIRKNSYFKSMDDIKKSRELYILYNGIITNIGSFYNHILGEIRDRKFLNTVIGRIEYVHYCRDKECLYIHYLHNYNLVLFKYDLNFDELIMVENKTNNEVVVPRGSILLFDFFRKL